MTIPKRIRVMPALVLCLVGWVVLFSLGLLLFGYTAYLSGFLLGSAGSALYMYLLYRRIPAMLTWSLILKKAPSRTGSKSIVWADTFKYLRSGWVKTVLPILSIALIILAFSRVFESISFLAALFGFFSFQISLFLYAVLILLFDFIQVSE